MLRRLFLAAFVLLLPSGAAAQSLITESLQPEYAERRARFMSGLPDGVVLVLGAREPSSNYLPFAQSASFYYLTGLKEPNSALVVVKRDGQVRGTLFVQPRDPQHEVWTGPRLGTAAVARITGLGARNARELIPALDTLLRGGAPLMMVADPGETNQPAWLRPTEVLFVDTLRARLPALRVQDVTRRLQDQRWSKSASELALIRRAAEITVRGHREAMQALEPGMNEFELQALIEYTFRRNGGDRPGFASIVGSGPNSTTLHYNANDRFMRDGEVVVIDVGASYKGYTADVTRTLPVNGTFTAEQREIYQIVRDAQAAAERQARVGSTAAAMIDSSSGTLAAGLARLGLIDSARATYQCSAAGQRCPQLQLFYMHGLGHSIGLEVHDPPHEYYNTQHFVSGVAFSIEPGIYVRANLLEDVIPATPANEAYRRRLAGLLPRYENIGVRIEDDYILTEEGLEWISRAPREIAEIEALMRTPYTGPAPRDPELVNAFRRDVP